jgi:hypothetical protein
MMIITSFERDCLARGSIPVTTKVPTRPNQEATSDTNMVFFFVVGVNGFYFVQLNS